MIAIPSPRQRLEEWGRAVPGIWRAVEVMRSQYRPDTAGWPSCVYLPLELAAEATYITLTATSSGPPRSPAELSAPAITTQCLAAWRMTQGIYRIDPTLYTALIDTPITGDVPADVLLYLPEWCVYVETPSMTVPVRHVEPATVLGLWYWLDVAPGRPHHLTLCIGIDTGHRPPLAVQHVPLVGSIRAAVNETLREWLDAWRRGNAARAPDPAYAEATKAWLPPALSLVLYLCSEAAEISGRHGSPGNPVPQRTRRKETRLFAADGPRRWEVGVRLGAALRSAYEAESSRGQDGERRHHVRPHVRRAHWHTFLAGPRDRERQRRVRWMPPIPVALDDYEDLPATVRPVHGAPRCE